MKIFEFLFRAKKHETASLAKERLKIVVAHERAQRGGPDYLQQMQQEIMEVIAKYVNVDRDKVQVEFEQKDDLSVLELNITLPEQIPLKIHASASPDGKQ